MKFIFCSLILIHINLFYRTLLKSKKLCKFIFPVQMKYFHLETETQYFPNKLMLHLEGSTENI